MAFNEIFIADILRTKQTAAVRRMPTAHGHLSREDGLQLNVLPKPHD